YHRSALRLDSKNLTTSQLERAVSDRKALFAFLQAAVCSRGFPLRSKDPRVSQPSVVQVFQTLVRDKSIEYNKADEGLMICFIQGWVQYDFYPDGEKRCVFPTPLHESYVEHTYFPALYTSLKSRYSEPLEIFLAVVHEFSQPNLLKARNGAQPGPGGTLRQKEAAFQFEFYRAYTSLFEFAGGISSEWSCGTGRIDACITELGWGFEFLRDGDGMTEHLQRFRPGGSYYGAIKDRNLKKWLVIDCRHSLPEDYYPEEMQLIRCVFNDEYRKLTVFDNENM
ncbi:hypothetical protein V8E54_011490, partial [Elaphomyces granulatus]